MRTNLVVTALILGIANWAAGSSLWTYSMPSGIEASSRFHVRVRGDSGAWRDSPVYRSTDQLNANREAAWTTFSFTDAVEIEVVSVCDPISHVTIRPKAYQVVHTQEGNRIHLTLRRPQKLCLEINNSSTHPLFIFADPPEQSPPDKAEKNTVFFPPGIHDIGDKYPLRSNTTYYLAGGAYVRGSFYATDMVENVTVRGRGILDSGHQKWNHPTAGMQSNICFVDGRNITLEGITAIEAGNFQIKLQVKQPDTASTFSNLKLFGWNRNSDGIHVSDGNWGDHTVVGNATGTKIVVRDCFVMANDDCVLVCDGVAESIVRNCVFWDNGYGATFCLSWMGHQDVKSSRIKGCHVIHKDGKNPVFRAQHAGEARIRNVLIEDVTVEGDIKTLVGLRITDHGYDRDEGHGSIDNVTFRNVTVEGQVGTNWILGYDDNSRISGIHFENLRIDGKCILEKRAMNLKVNEHAQNVSFGR